MRYLEEGIGILNLLLYNQQTISQSMWFYYPYFIYAILGIPSNIDLKTIQFENENQRLLMENITSQGFLEDYLENLISPLKNFI